MNVYDVRTQNMVYYSLLKLSILDEYKPGYVLVKAFGVLCQQVG